MPHLTGVLWSDTPALWAHVKPLIDSAAIRSGGRFMADDYFDAIFSQKQQLWLAWGGDEIVAVCITEIINYPKKRVLNIPVLAGHQIERWVGFLRHIEAWAKSEGCRKIEMSGRKGWRKILDDWLETGVILEKDI